MSIPIYQVDAFTNKLFSGNSAAVCLLDGEADAAWMQHVAMEMNLPETAFLHPQGDGYALRWFTPTVEVDLCGHATLAAAHVLFSEGVLGGDRVAFETRSGTLTCRREGQHIVMDFPAEPPHGCEAPPHLEAMLGAGQEADMEVRWVGANRFDLFVVLDHAHTVRGLVPNLKRLASLNYRGIIVSADDEHGEFDYVCRFFAPQSGIDEDPVTGSAHCALGPYWGAKTGKTELAGYQASARGGQVGVRLKGSRVELVGEGVTVVRGELARSPAARR